MTFLSSLAAEPFTRPTRWLLAGAAVLAVLAAPGALSAYGLVLVDYALVLAIACLGLNLLLGTSGLLPLGHALYFGFGAYVGAFLYRFGTLDSLETFLVVGIAASAAAAAVVGFLCVRASGIHFAILSLAFAELAHALVINGAVFTPFGGLGKALYFLGEGSLYLPRFRILGVEAGPHDFPVLFHAVVVAASVVVLLLLWRIHRSPFGLALRAIRDNATRAAFVGIPVRHYRWVAFVIAGALAGLAGGLYGQLHRQITPDQLHWLFSAKLVVVTVVGGTRQFLGPVLGAILFVALEEIAGRWPYGQYAILGGLLLLVGYLAPSGAAGAVHAAFTRLRPSGAETDRERDRP